jgi:transposase InsO family protein
MRGRGFRVESICRVLRDYGVRIAARTYRGIKYRGPSLRDVADAQVIEQMKIIRDVPNQVGTVPRERFYGRRKMTRLLVRQGWDVGEGRVGRLMRLAGMVGLRRSRRVITTKRGAKASYATTDLLGRDFTSLGPDRCWVTDMTYVRTRSGWVYVTFMTDLYSAKIVAWNAASTMTTKMVSATLTMAIWQRRNEGHPITPGLIHHSDHGSQYTSVHYGEQLEHAGISPSFGSVGDALDNAVAESVNGLYKAECVEEDGPFHTVQDVQVATASWVAWWNTERLHSAIGYVPPDEYEQAYYDEH